MSIMKKIFKKVNANYLRAVPINQAKILLIPMLFTCYGAASVSADDEVEIYEYPVRYHLNEFTFASDSIVHYVADGILFDSDRTRNSTCIAESQAGIFIPAKGIMKLMVNFEGVAIFRNEPDINLSKHRPFMEIRLSWEEVTEHGGTVPRQLSETVYARTLENQYNHIGRSYFESSDPNGYLELRKLDEVRLNRPTQNMQINICNVAPGMILLRGIEALYMLETKDK